jgi:hypothetical protein
VSVGRAKGPRKAKNVGFELDPTYVDVASRLQEERLKHPNLTMSQVDLRFITLGGIDWVVYTAAAYREPDDPRPGIGTAWERVPGTTPYTRNSELQNAETAAWGRALVAIGASTRSGIASADELKGRQEEQGQEQREFTALETLKAGLFGIDADPMKRKQFVLDTLGREKMGSLEELDEKEIAVVIQTINATLSRKKPPTDNSAVEGAGASQTADKPVDPRFELQPGEERF